MRPTQICSRAPARDSRAMPDENASPAAIRAVVIILIAMALLAVYANVQKFRRATLEKVIVTPVATPAPSAAGP